MSKKVIKKTIKIIATIVIIIAFLTGALYLSKHLMNGKYSPGTYVANINISFKTEKEALELLNKEKEKYLNSKITIKTTNSKISISPKDLGVGINMEDSLKKVKTVKSKEINNYQWIIELSKNKEKQVPIISFDDQLLTEKVKDIFDLKKLEPAQASFYFDENNILQIKEGWGGKVLDSKKLIKEIILSANELTPIEITLSLNEQEPVITKEVLETQKEEILSALNFEITLIDPVYSDDWYIKLIDYIDWVEFEPGEKNKVVIKIKKEKLDKFINEEISKWLDKPPQAVNIYRDEKGDIVIEGEGNEGMEILREELKTEMENAIIGKEKNVTIPIKKLPPIVKADKEFQELGIKEMLGVGHSSYYNSPTNRIHNIKTGASKFNATLVAPDEVLSFTKTLGRVDASTGYRQELVIKAEGTVPEYGGGLCQVSTTMYRAILFSGLPVVERHPHSYAVSYYSQVLGHGLDATIYIGGPDLKFRNDTGHHILIQAYVKDDYELYFVFYGTSDGRSVEMEGPYLSNYHSPGPTIYKESAKLAPGATKQVEKAHTGFNAVWYRHLTDKDGNTTKEQINTAYKAIPSKILIGPSVSSPTSEE